MFEMNAIKSVHKPLQVNSLQTGHDRYLFQMH